MNSPEQIGKIALIFLAFRDQLKIYHWQTTSYARHRAADKIVSIITEQMDRFMETLLGSRNMRLKMPSRNSIDFVDQSDSDILTLMKEFKKWLLRDLPDKLEPFDKDLSNIRDEILGSINKTIYLFSLE